MTERGYKSKIYLYFTSAAIFLIGVTYILWRWMFTLNLYTSPFTTFWSYALCIAEIIVLLAFTNFTLILLQTDKLKRIEIDNKLQHDYYKDFFYDGKLITFKNFYPSVDIFICTINEDIDILSTTIAAAKNIDYKNKKVYVLDDGRRAEVKQLTEMLGCNYITRDNNKGFKAGNINHALTLTDGEIIVIFDADHVPASTFLRETVYNFANPNMALVQTPQMFCNPDAFQKNLNLSGFLSNEQDMFYRIIEPGLNEFDSVFCGGTNILIKRKALNSVGNFPDTSITEDSLLGLMLHSAGYNIFYYNRPIAIGLAASTFEQYIKQRQRWAKGNIQIITNIDNWKYYAKLNAKQRFFYLTGMVYFFTPIARIIFIIAPILFLLYNISPVLVLFYQIIAFQVCYFSLKLFFIYKICMDYKNVIFADVYDLLTSIFTVGTILVTLLIPPKLTKIKFGVTKKNFNDKRNYKYLIVILAIFLILLYAEMQGIYDIFYSDVYSVLALLGNLIWNFINLIIISFCLLVVTDIPEKRRYQRVKLSGTIEVEDCKNKIHTADLYDGSRSGLSFYASKQLKDSNCNEFKTNINGIKYILDYVQNRIEGDKHLYKTKFKKPITIYKLTKRKIYQLEKMIQFIYKNPDKWDDFFKK